MHIPLETLQLEMDLSIRTARKVVRRFGTTLPYLFMFRPLSEEQWEVEPFPVVEQGVDRAIEATWKQHLHSAPAAVGSICHLDIADRQGELAPCIYACIYTDGGTHVTHRLSQYRIVDELKPHEKAQLREEYWNDFLEENSDDSAPGPVEQSVLRERFETELWPRLEPLFLVDFLEYLWDDVDAQLAPLLPVA